MLNKSRLFSTLGAEEIEKLITGAASQTVSSGKTLFCKADRADAVYVVVSGEIAIEIFSPQGKIVRIATLKSGAVFGEIAVLDGGARTTDARATEETQLLRIGESVFKRLTEEYPAFSMAIIKDLIGKLRSTDIQVEDISFKPLRSRLATLLMKLTDDTGEDAPTLAVTQSALAEQLSATREKVNVHLQAIQRANAIALRRGRIDILDRDKLREFIDEG